MKRSAPMKRTGRLKVRGRRRFRNGADPAYLDWVRSRPCLLAERTFLEGRCEGPTQPHHVRSKGAGGSDREVVPLCAKHHRWGHDQGWRTFQHFYGLDLTAIAERLAATYEETQ